MYFVGIDTQLQNGVRNYIKSWKSKTGYQQSIKTRDRFLTKLNKMEVIFK